MKSEGHHQGVVRTGMIHPRGFNPGSRNRFDSPSVAPSKTTNHSNLTDESERSKYSNCHVLPAIKSGHKSKGRRKLQQPASWWSEDKLDRLIGSDSSSAQDILDTLCDQDHDEL